MKDGYIKEDGFSLVEALVSIVIIGILNIIVLSFILDFSRVNKFSARLEALSLVRNEIRATIRNKSLNDTSYTNTTKAMTLYKHVVTKGKYCEIRISIRSNKNIELVSIPIAIKTNEIH